METILDFKNKFIIAGLSTFSLLAGPASAQDLIVDGSLCVGFDCVTGESFGFSTILMKENNLRITAQDTSETGAFPQGDWALAFNDTASGGINKFAIEYLDNSTTPFTIEGGAPSNALYVEDGGNVGLGTSNPALQMHIVDGNTPTVRLEQDGSSGFTAQTWDIAGNETNFFVRDVTNSSSLPFKIRPGAANDALSIGANSNVGIGVTSSNPSAALHVRRTNGTAALLVEEASVTAAPRTLFTLSNNGSANFEIADTSVPDTDNSGRVWKMKNTSGKMLFTTAGSDSDKEMSLDQDGNLTIAGNFIAGATTLNVPDYVFAADYDLRPLADVRAFIDTNSHLPEVPSAKAIGEVGLNMSEMQLILLKKVEELTLYTLEQDANIANQSEEIALLSEQLSTLASR